MKVKNLDILSKFKEIIFVFAKIAPLTGSVWTTNGFVGLVKVNILPDIAESNKVASLTMAAFDLI